MRVNTACCRRSLALLGVIAATMLTLACAAGGDGTTPGAPAEPALEPVSPSALAAAANATDPGNGTGTAAGEGVAAGNEMDHATGDEGESESDQAAADPIDHSDPNHTHDDPNSLAARFAEELFGANFGDYGASFTPDGATVLFTRALPQTTDEAIFVSERRGAGWTEPVMAPFSGEYHDKEAYVSPDGGRVYYASLRPVSGTAAREDFDIWYVERSGAGWSEPMHVAAVSSPHDDNYPAVAADGTLLFTRDDDDGNIDLWIAHATDDGLAAPRTFEHPINTVYPEADPWVSADGTTVIFTSPRLSPDAMGQGDMYVIHRLADGWSPPATIGTDVNSGAHEYGPAMSGDGSTFYFSRGFDGQLWAVPTSALANFERARQAGR